MLTILLGVLVFVASVSINFADGRRVQAIVAEDRLRAAWWAGLGCAGACVGFAVAVKVSLWMLPLEVLGYAVGAYLAVPRRELS